jgi:hypothetical protein
VRASWGWDGSRSVGLGVRTADFQSSVSHQARVSSTQWPVREFGLRLSRVKASQSAVDRNGRRQRPAACKAGLGTAPVATAPSALRLATVA